MDARAVMVHRSQVGFRPVPTHVDESHASAMSAELDVLRNAACHWLKHRDGMSSVLEIICIDASIFVGICVCVNMCPHGIPLCLCHLLLLETGPDSFNRATSGTLARVG